MLLFLTKTVIFLSIEVSISLLMLKFCIYYGDNWPKTWSCRDHFLLPHCSTWLASSHLQFQPLSIRLKYLKTFFWPGDLDLWPLTLTFETWPRYPSTWPTYQNSGLCVCPFKQESGNRHWHRHTMSKLLHPCNNEWLYNESPRVYLNFGDRMHSSTSRNFRLVLILHL